MKTKIKIHYTLYLFFIISFFCNFFFEMFLMFAILLLHEIGHIIFLKKYKRDISSITFYVFGGVIKHSNNTNAKLSEEFLIHFGGLLVNLILLFIFHTLNLQLCLLINFGIILFNIIPIYPLDGAKIFKTIINSFVCYKTSMYISVITSFITCIALFILNIFYIHSYYIVFLIIALLNINLRYCKDINKEYMIFLTNKYIYPNDSLKVKKVKRFKDPLNKVYLGRNTIFILDNINISEYDILKKHFSY